MSGKKFKVLVLDDELSVGAVLKRLLEKEGYEVWVETDPVKAIDSYPDIAPDCVLLDLKMPSMDGLEVMEKMKRLTPSVKVIVITGYGAIESAMEAMKLGAYDYITKPFDLSYIRTLVHKCLGD